MRKYSTILLIDDDSDDLDIFAEAIGDACSGISCSSHINPVKALGELKAAGELPDLILLDYNMPMLNGKEFLVQLRADNRLKDIPVVLMSTPAELFISSNEERADPAQYLCKPNSYEKLVSDLKEILLGP